MRVAIHQPNFLPWLGFFHKALHVDVFVLLDDIVFTNSPKYENHALLRVPSGTCMLTLPLSHHCGCLFNEVTIVGVNTAKLLRTVRNAYAKAPFFTHLWPHLEGLFLRREKNLVVLNTSLIEWVVSLLGGPKLVRSSALGCGSGEGGTQRIVRLCRILGATTYLSGRGKGSARYVQPEVFETAGVKVEWQEFTHPTYKQLSDPFIPGLSIVDLLFNHGQNEGRSILMGG